MKTYEIARLLEEEIGGPEPWRVARYRPAWGDTLAGLPVDWLDVFRAGREAYEAAAVLLERRHGPRDARRAPVGGPVAGGGWDAAGHWGVSPQQVAHAWETAGRRDSRKFRWLLNRSHEAHRAAYAVRGARRGDTLPWLVDYARGRQWLWRQHRDEKIPVGGRWSRQAIRALGRLSPELRRVAARVEDPGPGRKIRIRDMAWGAVARVQAMVTGDRTGRVRAALASGRRQVALAVRAGIGYPDGITRWLAGPAWPAVRDPAIARRLALGDKPAAIAGGILSSAEAHRWLSSGAQETPAAWLTRERLAGLPLPAAYVCRSPVVADWLRHVHRSGRWEALTRVREYPMPGGQQRVECRWIDRLDEIQDADLTQGPRTSVTAAFERAAERLGEAYLIRMQDDARILCRLPAGISLARGMTLLDTPARLVSEGRELGHCVGGYVPAVQSGQCVILAISSRRGRSTVEMTPDMAEVRQHRGVRNTTPPARHERLLAAWMRRRKQS